MNYFTEIATWILKCTFIAYHCVPVCAPLRPLEFWGGERLWPEIRGGALRSPASLHFNHLSIFLSAACLTRDTLLCDPTLLLRVLAVLGLYATSSLFVIIIIIIIIIINHWLIGYSLHCLAVTVELESIHWRPEAAILRSNALKRLLTRPIDLCNRIQGLLKRLYRAGYIMYYMSFTDLSIEVSQDLFSNTFKDHTIVLITCYLYLGR